MNITILKTSGCSKCGGVLKDLEALRGELPDMQVIAIDMLSDEGQKLVTKHGIFTSPGVLIEGRLAFFGPKSKEEIRTILSSFPSP